MGLRGIWILWITLSGERIGLLILCCITVGIWCRKFISLATPLETRKLMKKPWPLKLCEVFGRWCGLSAGHKQREANSYRWEDPLTIQEVWMIFHSTVPSSKENRRLKSMLKQGHATREITSLDDSHAGWIGPVKQTWKESKMLSAGFRPNPLLNSLNILHFPTLFQPLRPQGETANLGASHPNAVQEQGANFQCCNCAKCDWQLIFGHLHETSVDLIEIQEWFDDGLERNGLLTSYQVPFHRAGCKKVGTMACKAWICLKRFRFRSIGVILIELYKLYTMNYPMARSCEHTANCNICKGSRP